MPGVSTERFENISYYISNTIIASVSFVLTGSLICNFPQTGEISNFSL